MKRHIRHSGHKLAVTKRHELDKTNSEADTNEANVDYFQPNSTSTQKPKLNLTVSGYSNESMMNLLDDKYEFN